MPVPVSCYRRPRVAKRPARALAAQRPELFSLPAPAPRPVVCDEWLSPERIGRLLAVTPRTVQRWVATEGLEARRLGKRVIRVSTSALREWIARRSGRPCPDLAGPWLALGDVARLLGVSERTIADWARLRELPTRHLGNRLVRVCPTELAAWLEAQPRGDAR